jgi:hypothetical protein
MWLPVTRGVGPARGGDGGPSEELSSLTTASAGVVTGTDIWLGGD